MNFLQQVSLTVARVKRRIFHHIFLARFILIASALTLTFAAVLIFFLPVLRVGKDIFFGQVNVFSIVFSGQSKIKETDGRTNVLVLGTGNTGHEGLNLTDSILLVSFVSTVKDNEDVTKKPVTVISIPRDIYLDSLPGKINAAYADGEEKERGAGLILAKGAVSQIVGIPVHYAIQADFSAFQKVIDLLGGIDVMVQHQLDDPAFPISGKENDLCGKTEAEAQAFMSLSPTEQEQWLFFPCRYEKLHFDVGRQHMNGVTALKFVRSRHADGDEGTDFARSARQQQVVAGVKAKVFSTDTVFNPKRVEDIYLALKGTVHTDLSNAEINNLIPLIFKYRGVDIKSIVIDMNFLDNPPIDERGWILLPKGGNFETIQKFIKNELESK